MGSTVKDRRRKDDLAQSLYEKYKGGMTLEQISVEQGCSRQSVYGLFHDRGWPLRSKTFKSWVNFNGHRYTMRNNGYYGKTRGGRTLLHRDVWELYNGPIQNGYDIHHKDHDRTNNGIDNLELMSKSEHARRFAIGCNQNGHKPGCILTPSFRKSRNKSGK